MLWKKDVDRVKKAIYEAQMQADYIIISVHSLTRSAAIQKKPLLNSLKNLHIFVLTAAHMPLSDTAPSYQTVRDL